MIDLERYNTLLPYRVEKSKEEGFYEFYTDYDVHYSIGFQYDDLSLCRHSVYQFFIINVNHKTSPRDPKMRETVLLLIDAFFQQTNTTLLYICETGDGKQAMRNRLFQHWFSQYGHQQAYTFLSSSVVDEDGVMNYATIIIRNDNPQLAEVVQDFTETIQLLNSKPE